MAAKLLLFTAIVNIYFLESVAFGEFSGCSACQTRRQGAVLPCRHGELLSVQRHGDVCRDVCRNSCRDSCSNGAATVSAVAATLNA